MNNECKKDFHLQEEGQRSRYYRTLKYEEINNAPCKNIIIFSFPFRVLRDIKRQRFFDVLKWVNFFYFEQKYLIGHGSIKCNDCTCKDGRGTDPSLYIGVGGPYEITTTPLNANQIFTYNTGDGEKEYTLLSYCIFVLKDQMKSMEAECEAEAGDLAAVLLRLSTYQLFVGEKYKEACYIQKNDSRIRDVLSSALVNKRFNFAHSFLENCLLYKYVDANTVFMYDIGYGEKDYTLLTLCVFYALRELEGKFGAEWVEKNKSYFEDNVYSISKSDHILNECIENAQGRLRELLISLSEKTKPDLFVHI